MPEFDCSFLLTDGNRVVVRGKRTCSVSLWQIEAYGKIYGESLVLATGAHYAAYTGARRRPLWSLRATPRGPGKVAQYNERRQKVASPAVTGHIGEAMALPALCAAMPQGEPLAFVRLHGRAGRGPDYLSDAPRALWQLFDLSAPGLPPAVPIEVRARIGPDQKYPRSAEAPLKAYWRDCLRSGLSDRLRYGVVARVNLSSAGDQPSAIRFYLFVPDVVYDVATGGPS